MNHEQFPTEILHEALSQLKNHLERFTEKLRSLMPIENCKETLQESKCTVIQIVDVLYKIDCLNLKLLNAVEANGGGIFGRFIKKAFERDAASTYLFLLELCKESQRFACGLMHLFAPGFGMSDNIPVKYRPILALFLISHQGFRNPKDELLEICAGAVVEPEFITSICQTLSCFNEFDVIYTLEVFEVLDPRIAILVLVMASFSRVYALFDKEKLLKGIRGEQDYMFYAHLLESLTEIMAAN